MSRGSSRLGGISGASGSTTGCCPTLTSDAGAVIPDWGATTQGSFLVFHLLLVLLLFTLVLGRRDFVVDCIPQDLRKMKTGASFGKCHVQAASTFSVLRSGAFGSFCRKSADHTHLPYLQRMTFLRTGDYQSSIASFPPPPTRNSTSFQQEGPDLTYSWEKLGNVQWSSLASLSDPFTLSTTFTYIYAADAIVSAPSPSRVQIRLQLRSLVRCVDTRIPRQVDGWLWSRPGLE